MLDGRPASWLGASRHPSQEVYHWPGNLSTKTKTSSRKVALRKFCSEWHPWFGRKQKYSQLSCAVGYDIVTFVNLRRPKEGLWWYRVDCQAFPYNFPLPPSFVHNELYGLPLRGIHGSGHFLVAWVKYEPPLLLAYMYVERVWRYMSHDDLHHDTGDRYFDIEDSSKGDLMLNMHVPLSPCGGMNHRRHQLELANKQSALFKSVLRSWTKAIFWLVRLGNFVSGMLLIWAVPASRATGKIFWWFAHAASNCSRATHTIG